MKRESQTIGVDNRCPKCAKKFYDHSTALRHLKHLHAPMHSCEFCKKRIKAYGRPDLLRNHLCKCVEFLRIYPDNTLMHVRECSNEIYEKIKKIRVAAFGDQNYADSFKVCSDCTIGFGSFMEYNPVQSVVDSKENPKKPYADMFNRIDSFNGDTNQAKIVRESSATVNSGVPFSATISEHTISLMREMVSNNPLPIIGSKLQLAIDLSELDCDTNKKH